MVLAFWVIINGSLRDPLLGFYSALSPAVRSIWIGSQNNLSEKENWILLGSLHVQRISKSLEIDSDLGPLFLFLGFCLGFSTFTSQGNRSKSCRKECRSGQIKLWVDLVSIRDLLLINWSRFNSHDSGFGGYAVFQFWVLTVERLIREGQIFPFLISFEFLWFRICIIRGPFTICWLILSGSKETRFLGVINFNGRYSLNLSITGAWSPSYGRISIWIFGNPWQNNYYNFDLGLTRNITQDQTDQIISCDFRLGGSGNVYFWGFKEGSLVLEGHTFPCTATWRTSVIDSITKELFLPGASMILISRSDVSTHFGGLQAERVTLRVKRNSHRTRERGKGGPGGKILQIDLV